MPTETTFICYEVPKNLFDRPNAHLYLLYIISDSGLGDAGAKKTFWNKAIAAYRAANKPLNHATDIVPLCGTNQAGGGGQDWQHSKQDAVLPHYPGNSTKSQGPHAIFFLSTKQLKDGVATDYNTKERMTLDEETLTKATDGIANTGLEKCITTATTLAKHLATIWLLKTNPCATIAALRSQYCSDATKESNVIQAANNAPQDQQNDSE